MNAPPSEEEFHAVTAQAMAQSKAERPRAGAMLDRMALIIGWAWIGASALTLLIYLGPHYLFTSQPPALFVMAPGVVLPAFMIWFSGAAAKEGANARAEAKRLADAAEKLLNPSESAEAGARKLAAAVRVEISGLDRALEQTLAKLTQLQGVVRDQQVTVDRVSMQATTSASKMVSGLERERAELLQIAQDLNTHADLISQSISKHTAVIAEAADIADTQVKAADKTLEDKLKSFNAAAALINDRTTALNGAAQSSADSTLRLEQALTNALDVLARATNLTDAARQSADAAMNAAQSTAAALNDTTVRAIDDARRAADIIRGESARVERDAASALDRLGHAAEQAQRTAYETRRPTGVESLPEDSRPPRERPPLRPADDRRPSFGWGPAQIRSPQPTQEQNSDWSWRDVLSNSDGEDAGEPPPARRAPAAARRSDRTAGEPVSRAAGALADKRGSNPILSLIDTAGVHIGEAFSSASLDRVAQRARNGTQARRKAVKDAAPDSVRRLADYLGAHQDARVEAATFLRQEGSRIAEQIGRGRGSMGADSTRAFLLIDAALG